MCFENCLYCRKNERFCDILESSGIASSWPTGVDPAKNLTEFQAKALIIMPKTTLLFILMHFGTKEGGGGGVGTIH